MSNNCPITNRVRYLFNHAAEHFAHGSRELGMLCYLRGSDLLPDVPHPLDYLALVVQQSALASGPVADTMARATDDGGT